MKVVQESVAFLSRVRKRMHHDASSRVPLQMLRFEWRGDTVECDWLMRPPDPWDRELPQHLAQENQTLQALRDGMTLRELIFNSFSAVTTADLRMFRPAADHRLELLMTGRVSRLNEVPQRVASLAMRAKLSGFSFTLAEGVLNELGPAASR